MAHTPCEAQHANLPGQWDIKGAMGAPGRATISPHHCHLTSPIPATLLRRGSSSATGKVVVAWGMVAPLREREGALWHSRFDALPPKACPTERPQNKNHIQRAGHCFM